METYLIETEIIQAVRRGLDHDDPIAQMIDEVLAEREKDNGRDTA